MGESQLSCQRVTSNNQQPTTITMEMKLLIVLGAFFVVTLGSPVAEPEAEAVASPTADADAEADPHLLYYGRPYYGLGYYGYYGLGHYGYPYAYWGRKKREATAEADPNPEADAHYGYYGYGGWHYPYYGYSWPYYH